MPIETPVKRGRVAVGLAKLRLVVAFEHLKARGDRRDGLGGGSLFRRVSSPVDPGDQDPAGESLCLPWITLAGLVALIAQHLR